MTGENGGEEHLAPVIPLFGAAKAQRSEQAPQETGAWRSTWDDHDPSEHHPARGGRIVDASMGSGGQVRELRPTEVPGSGRNAETEARGTAGARGKAGSRDRARARGGTDANGDLGEEDRLELASEALVRRLRARPLSVAEATTFLRGQELASEQIAETIDLFCERRYLDDVLLAGHLVTSGHERKGQGRIALGRVLAQRGIPRDIADEALAELPEDDTERALEYARGKMPAMARLDPEVAKRRLSGQLARRGYPGTVVGQVIRQVFSEQFSRSRPGGVRFEESED